MHETNLAPDDAALERSRALTTLIRAEIAEADSNAIPFDRFMALALYTPELGYYQSDAPKFGEAGDFVTAPEASPLFSRCLAHQTEQVLSILAQGNLPQGDILEVGA
ncbi:MAG: SAM-dependent methyltransferase, partial [Gammaproteobacteria bacterium]|nr:SAM-dependent methyltransferase [Gammaproteobacteria bacterium]NNJ84342.1 SAM-dependent methyltransferase [Gammaproteobacteria bacterium]